MDISGSYRHRDVIFPFWDRPDLPVRVIWYEVPRGTLSLGTPHIFPLRDWDRRNEWIEPPLGSKYTTPEPYTGADPTCECITPTGTDGEWLNGLSYAAYLEKQDYRGVLSGKGQLTATVSEIVDVPVIGQVIDFAGNFVPTGWLECLGQAVSRVTYASLFAQLGITWGPGDGSTTFNLPPGAGVSVVGAGIDGDGNTYNVGDVLGANLTTLITDNLPGYNLDVLDAGHIHGITDPGHIHGVTDPGHVHALTDPGHTHGVTDPGHLHSINFSNAGGSSTTMTFTSVNTNRPGLQQTSTATTGLTVNTGSTGITVGLKVTAISIDSDTTAITINAASTGIIVNSKGMDVPISRRPPQAVMRRLIWPGP